MAPNKPMSSDDTEDTLDVACWLAKVVVIGGRVMREPSGPPDMIGTG